MKNKDAFLQLDNSIDTKNLDTLDSGDIDENDLEELKQTVESLEEQLKAKKKTLRDRGVKLKACELERDKLKRSHPKLLKMILRSNLLQIRAELGKGPNKFDFADQDTKSVIADEALLEEEFQKRLVNQLAKKGERVKDYDWYFELLLLRADTVRGTEVDRINKALADYNSKGKELHSNGIALRELESKLGFMDPGFVEEANIYLDVYLKDETHGLDAKGIKRLKKALTAMTKYAKTGGDNKNCGQYLLCLVEISETNDEWVYFLDKFLDRDLVERNLLPSWWENPREYFNTLSLQMKANQGSDPMDIDGYKDDDTMVSKGTKSVSQNVPIKINIATCQSQESKNASSIIFEDRRGTIARTVERRQS